MTRLFCPTCKELRTIAIEGEKTYTLVCAHTRPRVIPSRNGNEPVPVETPLFAKWYEHNIDPEGLGTDTARLKVCEEGARAFIANEERANAAWKARDNHRSHIAVAVSKDGYNCERN